MADTVKDERWKWIGGSDIPAIMGLSPFRTRWDVLLEKAELKESDFEGNAYTEYGNALEPQIRDYVNKTMMRNFKPHVRYTDDLRFNLDGWDEEHKEVLEIKTTSRIHGSLKEYKHYLAQLLPYMASKGSEVGILAVYERPEDFDEEFDPGRLTLWEVRIRDWSDFWEEIVFQLDRFREDLAKLRENPFLTEEDLMPQEVLNVAQVVGKLERQLEYLKETEKLAKHAKAELKAAMEKHGIKRWITNGGVKITLVEGTDDTVVSELNVERFQKEQPEVYGQYLEDRLKAGRSSYLKITMPKG